MKSIENAESSLESLATIPAAEITSDNTHLDSNTNTIQFDDGAALKLVIDDAEMSDNFINVNNWAAAWTMADAIYQSPSAASCFDGGNPGSANVPKFMVSNHISSIVPKVMGGIFYEDPPFLLRPRPGTSQDVVRAKTALFSFQLKDMHFEEECERTLDQMALLGTGIMKWGFYKYKKTVKEYRRPVGKETFVDAAGGAKQIDTPDSDDYEIVYDTKTIARPWIKYCDIRTVLVDTGCRYGDIQRANHVTYRDYVRYTDLEELRGVEGYDIPAEPVLRQFFLSGPSTGSDNITMTLPEGMRGYLQHALPRNFKTSADPLQNGMELLERWDKEKVIVALGFNGHWILIRNEANPYGKIPFFSANWRNIPDNFYGQGLGLLIGAEQLTEQGITNLALDLLAYGLQPTAIRKKGFNTPTQNTRWGQGRIIDVDDDVDKSFKFMQMPPVPSEAWTFIQQTQASGASTSGANEQVVQGAGAAGIHTTGMRSGTGAALVGQAAASRLDGPAGRFVRQIFEPWLYQMDDMNNDMLPTSVLKDVLGDEMGEILKVDHIEFRRAKIQYEVLAGAHLGAKKEMSQALPFVIQLLNNPTFVQNAQDAGYQFDAPAIFKAFTDAAGWKFSQDFLRKMTPVETQRHQANSPAAMQQKQIAANQQSQQQQFEHEEQLEDQKQLGKAGAEVLRQATEQATAPGEEQGTFGQETAL